MARMRASGGKASWCWCVMEGQGAQRLYLCISAAAREVLRFLGGWGRLWGALEHLASGPPRETFAHATPCRKARTHAAKRERPGREAWGVHS